MNAQQKWFYCLRAMESIRELSTAEILGDVDPFGEMAPEDKLEYINDLILGAIDMLDDVPQPVTPALS